MRCSVRIGHLLSSPSQDGEHLPMSLRGGARSFAPPPTRRTHDVPPFHAGRRARRRRAEGTPPPPCGRPATTRRWSRRSSPPLGPRLVEASGIQTGQRVLDVGAGTGNASIPAAQRGARGRRRAISPRSCSTPGASARDAAGAELDWVEADAEHLPFDDASFDVVMSAHRRDVPPLTTRPRPTSSCAPAVPAGRSTLLSWTPDGMLGDLFRTHGRVRPGPPPVRRPRRSGAARSISPACSATA